MMICFGWAIVQASREAYAGEFTFDEIDRIDDQVSAEDKRPYAECRKRLEATGDWLKWQFGGQLNNPAMLQFMTSQNHRTLSIWDLMEFLASQSKGTHGLLYVHDDEDQTHGSSFRVWRLLDGTITEHADPYLSPMTSMHAFGGEIGTTFRHDG